jgi:L-alanine-DL-glutamate epimerase-like enolase superfamily enzyme
MAILPAADSLLVKVTTDEGLVGWGEAFGFRAVPHSFYDGPGLLAAIHVTAALGTVDSMIEWRWFDLEATIYGDRLSPHAGRVRVPQGPGLGIDPDPEIIQAYSWT